MKTELDLANEKIAELENRLKEISGYAKLPSEEELVNHWYAKLSIDEATELAKKYNIPRDGFAPWQMGHYDDRKRAYLG